MQQEEFEASLKSLLPASVRVDAVKAAYLAGQKSCDRSLARWRGVAGFAAVFAVLPWVMPKSKPAVKAEPQIAGSQWVVPSVEVSRTSPANEQEISIPAGNMWQLRTAVLEKGLEALPNTPLPPARAAGRFDLF